MVKKGGILKSKNKKAESILESPIIFTILNLIFFALLFAFVLRSAGGALIYEKIYSRQIAFALDKAKPGMEIRLDFFDAAKIAKKNGVSLESSVRINQNTNEVIVSLSKKGSYYYKYFSDYQAESQFEGDVLVLKIAKKNGN